MNMKASTSAAFAIGLLLAVSAVSAKSSGFSVVAPASLKDDHDDGDITDDKFFEDKDEYYHYDDEAGNSTDLTRAKRSVSRPNCLNGWDVAVAVRLSDLNWAVQRGIDRREFLHQTLPSFTETKRINVGGIAATIVIRVEGLRFRSLVLDPDPAEDHMGRLNATFAAGRVVTTTTVGENSPVSSEQSVVGRNIVFPFNVRAEKLTVHGSNNRYKVQLHLAEDFVMPGSLEAANQMSQDEMKRVVAGAVRRVVNGGESFSLGGFRLSERTSRDLLRDIFPKVIRFGLFRDAADPAGRSVAVAFSTSDTSGNSNSRAYDFAPRHLIPSGNEFAVTISGSTVMRSMKKLLAKTMRLSESSFSSSSSCSSRVWLTSTKYDYRRSDVDLLSVNARTNGKRGIKVSARIRAKVVAGIKAYTDIDIYFSLSYRSGGTFAYRMDGQPRHSTEYKRNGFWNFLSFITFGLVHFVASFIESFADDAISRGISRFVDFDGASGGIPTDFGGVMGEVYEKLHIRDYGWSPEGNLFFSSDVVH